MKIVKQVHEKYNYDVTHWILKEYSVETLITVLAIGEASTIIAYEPLTKR